MARGNQTFSKSEGEKKKRKNRMEKEEKRQDTKANNNKGKPFEDMIAYVDEYGQLSDSQPEITRKKSTINSEDIAVSVARRADTAEDGRHTGVITFFNESKGYGFIKDTIAQESFFVHISDMTAMPKEGDKVNFLLGQGKQG